MKGKVDHTYLAKVLEEIQEQPPFRAQADREMDYRDNNQLDSDILTAMQSKGIPPSIENLIAGVISDITGMEEKNHTDYKVEPDGDIGDEESEEVAKAINYKLNKAEKSSGLDKAFSQGYDSQVCVGIGWVEIGRETNPFKPKYRTKFVYRNEIYWDMLAKEPDLSDARWLLRRRWTDKEVAMMMFPKYKEIVRQAAGNLWLDTENSGLNMFDQVGSTGLAQSWDIERGWSIEEQEWRIVESGRVCIFELHTREWEEIYVLKIPGGRVVELDPDNKNHGLALTMGAKVEKAKVSKIYKHFFLGPHHLHTEQSEFQTFNYVPIWGSREDRTGIPYGVIRLLMYMQDEVNARISKMQWLLSSTYTEYTEGALAMDDETFSQEVGRPDARVVLDQAHMALSGSSFERKNNESLNEQQYKRLVDLRESIKRIGLMSDALNGEASADNSSALSQMIEQSVQGLARINGNFAYARMLGGQLLMSMIIKDMGGEQHTVKIKGNVLREDTVIGINTPATHPETGHEYLNNDVQRTMLKVALEDVPSTSTFRKQELASLSEFAKSLPEEYRVVMAPFMMDLSSSSGKDEMIKAMVEIRDGKMLSVEQVEGRVKEAVELAKTKLMIDLKERDLDIKEKKTDAEIEKTAAEIEKIVTEQVNNRIEAIYSAVQAAGQIVSMPAVVPVSDQVLKSAGGQDQDVAPIIAAPPGQIPEAIVQPEEQQVLQPEVTQNTSPMFPPRVQDPELQDPPEPDIIEPITNPETGINEGIEAEGVQL